MRQLIPIARDIEVKIKPSERLRIINPSLMQVSAETAPTATIKAYPFIKHVFPKKKIIHLSRPDLVNVSKNPKARYYSSLFWTTVMACFKDHYPLAISPEILMYLISHEIGITVKQNPEDYRGLFTTSAKKEEIVVQFQAPPGAAFEPNFDWQEKIAAFGPALRERVPDGIMGWMLPGFSTDTPSTEVASLVAFMDAASPYYEYTLVMLCGIPRIRLLGTANDYAKLLASAAQLAEVFKKYLGAYFDNLLPVLKTLSEQASGAPVDDDFWSSIFRLDSGSGGSADANGWLTAFVAYERASAVKRSHDDHDFSDPRREGKFVLKSSELFDWRDMRVDERGHMVESLDLANAPVHVSTVPFTLDDHGKKFPLQLLGGVMAIENLDGFLHPGLSFGVLGNK